MNSQRCIYCVYVYKYILKDYKQRRHGEDIGRFMGEKGGNNVNTVFMQEILKRVN